MSPRGKFDRYMIAAGAARHAKFRRLNTNERHAFFMGVLSLAAQAPIRGCLLIGELEADARDVAGEADVPERVAESALVKLRQVGVIYRDEALGCERVHDFEEWNPAPKKDTTNAERQRRYKERRNARGNDAGNGVTAPLVTAPATAGNALAREEVEVEVEVPPSPQGGGRVIRFDRKPVPQHRLDLAEQILAEFNQQAGTGYQPYTGADKPSEGLRRIIGALTARPAVDLEQAAAAIRWQLAHPYWDGAPQPGNVFGPGVFDGAVESSAGQLGESSNADFVARMNSRRSSASNGDAA